jgi:transposase
MEIVAMGIDFTHAACRLAGRDGRGKIILAGRVERCNLLRYLANLPPCLIGLEASGSTNYWARKLMASGHTVRLISPRSLKRYLHGSHSFDDRAQAICEGLATASLSFVEIKPEEQ